MNITRSTALEFRIPADVRYVSLVRRGIRSLAESVGFAREDVADVEVAVSEAVTNSVEHGCPQSSAAAVVVRCCVTEDCLVVEVEDESPAEALPTCSNHCNPADERGRGVLIMRALMDECEDCRTDRGMKVRMAKQKGTGEKDLVNV